MKVIFFDGVCGLCNGFVDFIMKIDKHHKFHFSPLQSEFAHKKLPADFTNDLKSVVYLDSDNKMYTRSDAVIRILAEIGGLWSLSSVAKFLPKSFLDLAYNMVAENRYKLFGKKESCRLPTAEERSRFLTSENLNSL